VKAVRILVLVDELGHEVLLVFARGGRDDLCLVIFLVNVLRQDGEVDGNVARVAKRVAALVVPREALLFHVQVLRIRPLVPELRGVFFSC
jgi:hypothetical protein